MKPKELSRKSPAHSSFSVSKHRLPHFLNVWHYHDEIELVYISKSTGTKFIGDSINKFQSNDLVLIGSRLPHLWLNDKEYFDRNDLEAEALVIHFHPSCLGEGFFQLPELKKIGKLLQEAKVGLEINGKSKSSIIKSLAFIMDHDGCERFLEFIKILSWIADEQDTKELSSLSFIDAYSNFSGTRLDTVYQYIFNNFKENIDLDTVAGLANMNSSSFSRYFKRMTNKTFTVFVNEVRIGFACKLILEQSRLNIAEIGFESGYNNLSNFNKQFKTIVGMSPTDYQRAHFRVENFEDAV
jgi:AraC-like DNA-binding protein